MISLLLPVDYWQRAIWDSISRSQEITKRFRMAEYCDASLESWFRKCYGWCSDQESSLPLTQFNREDILSPSLNKLKYFDDIKFVPHVCPNQNPPIEQWSGQENRPTPRRKGKNHFHSMIIWFGQMTLAIVRLCVLHFILYPHFRARMFNRILHTALYYARLCCVEKDPIYGAARLKGLYAEKQFSANNWKKKKSFCSRCHYVCVLVSEFVVFAGCLLWGMSCRWVVALFD